MLLLARSNLATALCSSRRVSLAIAFKTMVTAKLAIDASTPHPSMWWLKSFRDLLMQKQEAWYCMVFYTIVSFSAHSYRAGRPSKGIAGCQ